MERNREGCRCFVEGLACWYCGLGVKSLGEEGAYCSVGFRLTPGRKYGMQGRVLHESGEPRILETALFCALRDGLEVELEDTRTHAGQTRSLKPRNKVRMEGEKQSGRAEIY